MKSPLSETIQERITLLQQCTQFVALRIVVQVPHEGIVFQKLEENIPQFPPAFQRLAIVLHLTTSSVVNKGLIRLQIVPCSISSIADNDKGATYRSYGTKGTPSIASGRSQIL